MGTLRKTAIVVLCGLSFGSAAIPVQYANAVQPASIDSQAGPANKADHSLLAVLGAVMTESAKHEAKAPCKAPYLYSQHDVVGDPEACFMGQATFGTGAIGTSGAGLSR
jgi:hypothetical protein